MPALQVLNSMQQPSYSSQLGSALGQGLGQGLSQGIGQYFQMKRQKSQGSALAEYLGKPEMAQQLGALSPEIQQEVARSAVRQKQEVASNKEAQQQSLNSLIGLSKKVSGTPLGLPISPNLRFGGEAGEFESQKGQLVSAMRDLINKGILSNQKFQYIVNELLPSHRDKQSVKLHKLKAIGEQLGLDISSIEGENKSEVEQKPKIFGGGRIKITDPKTKQVFYPSSMQDVKEAKDAGWRVTGGE
jgi:hypothetical protein